ncbi:MAG: sensor histidine kinase [Rhizobacter sp.]|nr:sensor histidine kinase [Rhizobacter sp.]
MPPIEAELAALAAHMIDRREAILYAWRRAVMKDPSLSTADSLPRAQLNDHIPALLQAFERRLNPALESLATAAADEADDHAAAHGLHRWQQGYDLRELSQELGRLNECVVVELEGYAQAHPDQPHEVMATARWMWAELSAHEFSASIAEYFRLQQLEAAGHVKDLEQALRQVEGLEQQRAHRWREAVHDLLDEVTDLARLQAGKEQLQSAVIDVAALMGELAVDLRDRAQAHGLFLRCEGPAVYVVEGDAIKIRRIAQNLVLNALKYTRQGGIQVRFGDSDARDDGKRWVLSVQDSGPGFDSGPGSPMVTALSEGTDLTRQSEADAVAHGHAGDAAADRVPAALSQASASSSASQEPGEGIGLSIVKRLAELLHASVEVDSGDQGTTFSVYLPKQYGR